MGIALTYQVELLLFPLFSNAQFNSCRRSSYLDCKVPAESDGEPVEDFDDGDEADSEAKSAKPSQAGDEVKPGHLWGFLKLCKQYIDVSYMNSCYVYVNHETNMEDEQTKDS